MITTAGSLATGQRSLGDPSVRYPLWPPLTAGCPGTSTDEVAYPVEVDYAYDRLDAAAFLSGDAADSGRPHPGRSDSGRPDPHRSVHGRAGVVRGLERWAPLLPPLAAPGLGEGGTPLIGLGDGVYVKDESRNPTWSHKDRLNRCTVSAAVGTGAPGVVVASSGNHGASAAAYAARAGLRCVVLAPIRTPASVAAFLRAYGATVLPVPLEARWPLMRQLVDRVGLHPVSNLTEAAHTGHGFGPEGYKTVAYEIVAELGDLGVPADVYVPTGYGELLFGVWKGFAELHRLGLTDRVPRVHGCEAAAGAPLAAALRASRPAASVEVGPTEAYSIACSVNSYRGVLAVRESGGEAVPVSDGRLREARDELARHGLWAELSAAAGLAGLRERERGGAEGEGPVVCVSTSSGFKDFTADVPPEAPVATWADAYPRLRAAGLTV